MQLFGAVEEIVRSEGLGVSTGRARRLAEPSCVAASDREQVPRIPHPVSCNHLLTICLVPEWRVWRWPSIRRWKAPVDSGRKTVGSGQGTVGREGEKSVSLGEGAGSDALQHSLPNSPMNQMKPMPPPPPSIPNATSSPSPHSTFYLPVFYIPGIGRSLSAWFYYRALKPVVRKIREEGESRIQNSGVRMGKQEVSAPHSTIPPFNHSTIPHSPHSTIRPFDHSTILLGSWLYPDAVAAAWVARETGAPVWLRVHGTDRFHLDNPARRRQIMDAVSIAQGVVCNCRAVADDLIKRGIPADKLHIIPNGVNTTLFRYRDKGEALRVNSGMVDWWNSGLDKRWNGFIREDRGSNQYSYPHRMTPPPNETNETNATSSPPPPTILFIANLVPIKGPDVMIKAFAEVEDRRQKTEFRIQESGVRMGEGEVSLDAFDSLGSLGEGSGGGDTQHPLPPFLMPPMKPMPPPPPSSLPNATNDTNEPNATFSPAPHSPIPPFHHSTIPPSPHLLILGSGPLRPSLERLASELGVADRVHFLGSRPHAEIALWMNIADVLCLTSRSEGMPNVVMEALASGLPVVATDVGACPELLADEPGAKLCRREDVASVAEGLLLMLSTQVDRPALAARRGQHSSWAWQAEKLLQLVG